MVMTPTLITERTSRDVHRYQSGGGDIAILPVGSVEPVARWLPVGARTFVVEAFSHLLAAASGGMRLPAVALTPARTPRRGRGAVDVPERALRAYVRAVLDDLLATAFRRIVLVTYDDYLRYYLPHEFYEDHGVALAGFHMGEALHGACRERGTTEDAVVLGAMHVLGRDELVGKCLDAWERVVPDGGAAAAASPDVAALHAVGSVGVRAALADCGPTSPARPDAAAGRALLEDLATSRAPAFADLGSYNDFLARRADRGMMRGMR
jgi:hypothetical protein